MGAKLEQYAIDTAAQVQGGILGLIAGRYNDKRQLKQQRKLQELQIAGSKELTDYEFQKQMQMWKDTSYHAQIEQLKKAGLNPGLIYGMSGGGGQTIGGGVAQPTGATASQGGGGEIGMGIQAAMMGAQLRLMEAQAKKTEQEAKNIGEGGIDTNVKLATIADLTQGIKNKEAVERLTNVQTNIAKLDEEIKGKTKDDAITAIQHSTLKIMDEARSALAQANVDEATWETKIKTIEQELTAVYLRNELTGAQIAKTETEIQAISEQLVQGWHKLNIDFANANTHRAQLQLEQYIRNVRESTKLTYETVKGIVQAILLRGR